MDDVKFTIPFFRAFAGLWFCTHITNQVRPIWVILLSFNFHKTLYLVIQYEIVSDSDFVTKVRSPRFKRGRQVLSHLEFLVFFNFDAKNRACFASHGPLFQSTSVVANHIPIAALDMWLTRVVQKWSMTPMAMNSLFSAKLVLFDGK